MDLQEWLKDNKIQNFEIVCKELVEIHGVHSVHHLVMSINAQESVKLNMNLISRKRFDKAVAALRIEQTEDCETDTENGKDDVVSDPILATEIRSSVDVLKDQYEYEFKAIEALLDLKLDDGTAPSLAQKLTHCITAHQDRAKRLIALIQQKESSPQPVSTDRGWTHWDCTTVRRNRASVSEKAKVRFRKKLCTFMEEAEKSAAIASVQPKSESQPFKTVNKTKLDLSQKNDVGWECKLCGCGKNTYSSPICSVCNYVDIEVKYGTPKSKKPANNTASALTNSTPTTNTTAQTTTAITTTLSTNTLFRSSGTTISTSSSSSNMGKRNALRTAARNNKTFNSSSSSCTAEEEQLSFPPVPSVQEQEEPVPAHIIAESILCGELNTVMLFECQLV